MLENMLIMFNTDFWTSGSLSAVVIKANAPPQKSQKLLLFLII